MRPNAFLILFFLISLVHLPAEFMGWFSIVFWTKILLMPSLWLAMWSGLQKPEFTRPVQWATAALIFSTAGDVFLLNEKSAHQPVFFYLGLGAFLMAQVSYILAFIRSGTRRPSALWTAAYLIYFAGFMWLLLPELAPSLLVAVVFYGLALTAMAWNSWRTLQSTGQVNWIQYSAVAGAVLFLISDGLLAFNRFKTPLPHAGFWIMLTYIAAQYLIINGIIKSGSKHTLTASTG